MTPVVAVVGLLFLAGIAARLDRRRRVRRAARNIRNTMEAVFSGPHTYRETSLRDFPHLDHAFYEEKTGEFAALDFAFLGDLEDVTINEARIGVPTAVRVMLSEDRKVLGVVYHAEVGGRSARVVELETVLDDGRFLLTSTATAAAPLSMPPEVDRESHPAGTSPGSLVRAHTARLRDRLAAAGGASAVAVGSLAEVVEHQRRMDEAKARFRKESSTLVSREELQRIGGPGLHRTATEVAREMARDAGRG